MKTKQRFGIVITLCLATAAFAETLDATVLANLRQHGITPAPVCSDSVFVRRVYLDVIGTLPTGTEAHQFITDRNADKRSLLIDRLLERKEFADCWSLKWCDLLRVKSEYPINLWPNAVQAYHRWVWESLQTNKPYDQFVREMLTTSGSNFRAPPVNFYRAIRDREPSTIAQAVALTFMGARIDHWTEQQQTNLASFFQDVRYKKSHEWKEEIVYIDQLNVSPRTLTFPDETRAQLTMGQDARILFADWLTQPDNPWFARNITNRIWFWLMGNGIIHEPDDIRPDNPPINPELLSLLESELVSHQYDLKHIYRLILNSETYQRSSIPADSHPDAERLFAHYPLRRLGAEVLIDAINQVTGGTETYVSLIPEPWTYIPKESRSIELADASISSPFLELFGRPARDTGLESERNNKPSGAQCLHLLNSSHIRNKLTSSNLLRALTLCQNPVDELYLTILSRYPTDEERAIVARYNPQDLGAELAWVLINTAEFQTRH
jgi:hypothetical protein